MPLAPRPGGVAVILEYLGYQCTAPGNHATITIPVIRQFADLPVTDPMMIAAGQQGCPCRRAHSRGVEAVVRDPLLDDAVHRRSMDLATERGGQGGPCVVNQYDENVRRIGWKPARRNPLFVNRLLHRAPSDTGRWRWRER